MERVRTISELIERLGEVQHEIENASTFTVTDEGWSQLLWRRYELVHELYSRDWVQLGATGRPKVASFSTDMEPKAMGQLKAEASAK